MANPTVYTYATETFTAADYPFATLYEEDAPNNTSDMASDTFGASITYYLTQDYVRLKAVIKKSGVWYYIWSTT